MRLLLVQFNENGSAVKEFVEVQSNETGGNFSLFFEISTGCSSNMIVPKNVQTDVVRR